MEAKKINDSNKELKMKQRIRCLIIICFIIMIILIIVIFLKNKKLFNNQDIIKGLWNIDGTTKYEFDGKGEGKMILPSSEYKFIYKITENEDEDWILCYVKDCRFEGAGDPSKLEEIIRRFKEWVEQCK